MFTGIIEEMGRVVSLTLSPNVTLWDGSVAAGYILVVSCQVCLEGAYIGCSIAVNGTCLTVTEFTSEGFTVNCAPETMRLTNLIDLKVGSPVNLERSARADARNSGHYVQGHVDGTGVIVGTWKEGDSLWVRVAASPTLTRYIVPKGYVAVDGTSLTVCEVVGEGGVAPAADAPPQTPRPGTFTFMLIAHTQKHIIVPLKAIGDKVNLEVDVMGKLAERSVAGVMEAVESLGARLQAALDKLVERVDRLDDVVGLVKK